jgi:type VI secretion system protein ImpA
VERLLTTSATIDVEALLAPISQDAPTGVDLRLDTSPKSVYYQLKDLRSAARAAERRADSEGDSQGLSPEWQGILTLASKALGHSSKDLEVAAWLIEALVRAHGFAGLRDGLGLANGLVERYWETFYSLQDEEGLDTRLAPLAGLNGALAQPLRKVPLTVRHDSSAYAAYHFDQAFALGQVEDPEARARREAAGELTMDKFTAAVNASGGEFYIELLQELADSLAALEKLTRALDERAGSAAPVTSDVNNVIVGIQDSVKQFSADLVARATAVANAGGDSVTAGDISPGANSNGHSVLTGSVTGREDALRVLGQIAKYFRANEPHSPIADTLDELVRRARLPFAELLAELVQDHGTWRNALTSAGIKPPE